MGMTIDNLKLLAKGLECMGDTEHAKDIRQAIDTMRKYQKIQEIVAKWKVDTWTDGVSYDCMVQISEVLEDGNDNKEQNNE